MDKPGRELPKDFRIIALELTGNQGWRYRINRGHGMLYPADPAQPVLIVPTTPSDHRALRNFIADVRRRGGQWPVDRKGR